MDAYARVLAARAARRPTATQYLSHLISDFIELHGDRRYADDAAVIGGIGRIGGRAVTVIALERGCDTADKVRRNFGSAHPEGYRKALRLMQQAEKFRRPIVCLVDTAGAFCGTDAEERGQGQAIAENLYALSQLKTPILSLLIGEGGSGGALALALSDRVWMMENAVYSVISPEGCASILWKDAGQADRASACLKLTAQELFAFGVCERVFPEPEDFGAVYPVLQEALQLTLEELCELDEQTLLQRRYDKFRRIGAAT